MITTRKKLTGAVDVGGTKVAVGLVDPDGQVIERREIATSSLTSSRLAVAEIASRLQECLNASGADLSGIGIGSTGPVDPITGVVGKAALLPGWEGCALVDELSGKFGVGAAMENDADAAAIAEATWGSGRGVDRFLYVTLSTGIGTGLVIDGVVYRGVAGSHPEMGHHTIDPAGPECYCGAHGCWESLASGSAIRSWFLENDSSMRVKQDAFDAKDVFDLYRGGDHVAARAVERLATYVGIGLANLTTILVPEVIAVGGGLIQSADLFLNRAIEVFRARCLEVPSQKVVTTPALLRSNVGLIGAGAVWMQRQSSR